MSLNWPNPHHGFVPEYQVSSWPYVTSSQIVTANSIKKIEFPGVTRWIVIHNLDNSKSLRVGFTRNCFLASNSNYFSIENHEMTPRLEVKCKEIFITSPDSATPFSIIAGYTNINTGSFPILTGSNGWQGIG